MWHAVQGLPISLPVAVLAAVGAPGGLARGRHDLPAGFVYLDKAVRAVVGALKYTTDDNPVGQSIGGHRHVHAIQSESAAALASCAASRSPSWRVMAIRGCREQSGPDGRDSLRCSAPAARAPSARDRWRWRGAGSRIRAMPRGCGGYVGWPSRRGLTVGRRTSPATKNPVSGRSARTLRTVRRYRASTPPSAATTSTCAMAPSP